MNTISQQRRTAVTGLPEAEVFDVSDAAGAGAQPRLKLTRLGRLVFGGLATVLVAGLLAGVAAFAATEAEATLATGEQEFSYVLVQHGATLWNIAEALDPDADPRDLVAEIAQLNQLDDSAIEAGDALAVPLRFVDVPGVLAEHEL